MITSPRGTPSRRPHVILVHRYFFPDTPPYASILGEIANGLAESGMDVTVLTCQPSYNRKVIASAPARERLGGHIDITRWPVLSDRSSTAAKIVNMIIFSARVLGRLARTKRLDAVMAASTPPVAVALAVSIVARIKKVPFVYHKQDIYPEVVAATNRLAAPVRDLLQRLDSTTDRRASRVVVLSEDMAETTVSRGVDRRSIAVINNFDPWILAADSSPRSCGSDQIRFVYAGNLGRFQNLEGLAELVRCVGDERRFRFDFIGDGPMRPWLERYVLDNGLHNVRFHGYLDPKVLADRLRHEFDVGVLSLHPGVIRAAYPSKLMSYLRNGLPVLALVEHDSELIGALDRGKAGWAADPQHPEAAAEILREIADDRDRLPLMREHAREMYELEFGRSRQMGRWVALFRELVGSR